MDGSAIVFIIAIIAVGVLIFFAILLTGKHNHRFNKEDYQMRFQNIEKTLGKDNPASFALTIIQADKLLDKALMEIGISGKTMGDRLKKAGDRFTELNSVWRAHKLRNCIAHDPDFEIKYQQTANALAVYKQALKDLGAI